MKRAVFIVPGAKTQEEADRILAQVMIGSQCTWPDKPSRLLIDYVMVECLKTGLLEVEGDEAIP